MIRITKPRLAAALFALAAWLPLQANAGLLDDDEARKAILDLRAKVEALSKDLNSRIDTKADKSGALNMVNQQEQVAAEIAKLRGQLEVLSNDIVTIQKRQKDFYADLDTRLKKLEPSQVIIEGKEALIVPTEQRAYDSAMQTLKGGDYKAATAELAEFVRSYPNSGYTPIAQYWLGNAFSALNDCKNANAAHQVVVTKYRDSAKAPDALLGIATCHLVLKDKVKARKALQDLIAAYPDSTAAATARERLPSVR
ncbi:MAG: tol-pal system protein YbgF [Pseudomonadota bacterium]